MLKTRVIPIVLLKDGEMAVKSVRFDWLRPINHPINSARVYNARDVDELIFLDISATREQRRPLFDLIALALDECFMPLTVGGGIKDMDDIHALLKIGADKVAINTQAALTPDIVTKGAKEFGSQCIVASIDVKETAKNKYEVFTHCGKTSTGLDPVEWAKEMEARGAGEILVNSIDRDGTEEGYSIPLIRRIADAMNIPVIAAGGAGSLDDFVKAVKEGHASAVAASSIFLFTDTTPNNVKEYMKKHGINTRI